MTAAENQIELQRIIDSVSAAQRSALLLDYDGTLAPFSTERLQALPYAGVVPILEEIIATGRTRVVVVSGRSASDVVSLLGIDPHPEIWGAHGVERRLSDGTSESSILGANVLRALDESGQWLETEGIGSLSERKAGGIAVHWRGLPESKAAEIRERVLRGWFPIAQREVVSILEFDGGVEIRVCGVDKGDAVRKIVEELDATVPVVYLGDDATDERAFEALASRGVSILVRPEYRKTSARLWLRPPEELLSFLNSWLHAAETAATSQQALSREVSL